MSGDPWARLLFVFAMAATLAAVAPGAHARPVLPFPWITTDPAAFPLPQIIGHIRLKAAPVIDESEQSKLSEVDGLLAADQADDAARISETELRRVEATYGANHPVVAAWLMRLGLARELQNDYVAAERHYLRALAIREKTSGADSLAVGETLLHLTVLCMKQERAADAERYLTRALSIYEKANGPDHPDVIDIRETLALHYFLQGRYDESDAVFRQVLAARERTQGPEHPSTITTLLMMARSFILGERFAEAEVVARRALAVRERRNGPNHPDTAEALGLLATACAEQGRYLEAEPLFRRTVIILETATGPLAQENLAFYLGKQSALYRELGRFGPAETTGKRSLELFERLYGPDDRSTGAAIGDLALLYWLMGRYADSERLLTRAIAIFDKTDDGRLGGKALNNLATLYVSLARFEDAENLYKRAALIQERRFGPDHPELAVTYQNMAALFAEQGRFAESEPLYLKALSIYEKSRGPDHPSTALVMINYAFFLDAMNRRSEAGVLRARGLAVFDKAVGGVHPVVGTTLMHVSDGLLDDGRYAEAEMMARRSVGILESSLGADHPDIALALDRLAEAMLAQQRFSDAEQAARRALAISEGNFGRDAFDTASHLQLLARISRSQKRLVEAETLLRRALSAYVKGLPPSHPHIRGAHVALSEILLERGRVHEAVAAIREAIAVQRGRQMESASLRLRGRFTEEIDAQRVYAQTLRALYALAHAQPGDNTRLLAEAFEAAQLAEFDETAQAMLRMSAQFAAGSGALAVLLREQHRLQTRLPALQQLLAQARVTSDPAATAQTNSLHAEIAAIDARLQEIDGVLRRDHPVYAELVDPKAVRLADAQALLNASEAIALQIVTPDGVFVFAVTDATASWTKVAMDDTALAGDIAALRRQLDPDQWQASFMPFDRTRAHRLYRNLWAIAETDLKAKTQLFVVATGPLTSLPQSVLVTEQPAGGAASDADPQALRNTAWLAKRHALVTMPSISNLKALRRHARKGAGREPFAGFGDPALSGAANDNEPRARSVSSVFRGASPDPAALRTLSPLPGTAVELRALAKALGASEAADVYLREQATEARVKTTDLSRKRVLAFATHGLMAGDLGLGEPGLVFTPPAAANDRDDGYLSASEAAQLDLRADWIILSACNTAAGETPGAKGLSGLARGFFLAGARSLLVSHWSVWDDAAGLITTATVKNYEADPKRGRAQALRAAMLALMQDPTRPPRFAHPAAWAPFVLVGEPRPN